MPASPRVRPLLKASWTTKTIKQLICSPITFRMRLNWGCSHPQTSNSKLQSRLNIIDLSSAIVSSISFSCSETKTRQTSWSLSGTKWSKWEKSFNKMRWSKLSWFKSLYNVKRESSLQWKPQTLTLKKIVIRSTRNRLLAITILKMNCRNRTVNSIVSFSLWYFKNQPLNP